MLTNVTPVTDTLGHGTCGGDDAHVAAFACFLPSRIDALVARSVATDGNLHLDKGHVKKDEQEHRERKERPGLMFGALFRHILGAAVQQVCPMRRVLERGLRAARVIEPAQDTVVSVDGEHFIT